MNSAFSLKNLLLMMIFLLVLRFVLVPVIDWQQEKLNGIEAKELHLLKVEALLGEEKRFRGMDGDLRNELDLIHRALFQNDQNLKLEVQTIIEGSLTKNGLTVRSFSWISDRGGDIRTLKARVTYSGAVNQLMMAYWELSSMPQLLRIIESQQRLKKFRGQLFEGVEGALTIEIYSSEGLDVASKSVTRVDVGDE